MRGDRARCAKKHVRVTCIGRAGSAVSADAWPDRDATTSDSSAHNMRADDSDDPRHSRISARWKMYSNQGTSERRTRSATSNALVPFCRSYATPRETRPGLCDGYPASPTSLARTSLLHSLTLFFRSLQCFQTVCDFARARRHITPDALRASTRRFSPRDNDSMVHIPPNIFAIWVQEHRY